MAKWDHKKVYDALVKRGMREKESDKNKYVELYPQDTNCALLSSPNSVLADTPVNLNPLGPKRYRSWDMNVYKKIRPHIDPQKRDSKTDPEQDFVHYSVNNWDQFATALGL